MLCFHVGPHKSGASHIQSNFLSIRDGALNEAGWVYPDLGLVGKAHNTLALGREKFIEEGGEHFSDFSALRDLEKNIIFSSELFSSWNVSDFQKAANHLGVSEKDVHIVYILRDPLDSFYAYWKEEVQQGYYFDLPSRFAEHFVNPLDSDILNPFKNLDSIHSDSDMKLHVIHFEGVKSAKRDLFNYLCSFIAGLEDVKGDVDCVEDYQNPVGVTEFLRVLNHRYAKGAGYTGPEFAHKFSALIDHKEAAEIDQIVYSDDAKAYRVLNVSRQNHIYDLLKQQFLDSFSDNIMPKVTQETIFSNDDAELIYLDTQTLLSNPDIKRLMDVHFGRIKSLLSLEKT